jgi:hypothetical protein
MKTKLTPYEKRQVREWLGLELASQCNSCPFGGTTYIHDKYYEKICKPWFPQITYKICPCHVYKFSTVKDRAREMVEE